MPNMSDAKNAVNVAVTVPAKVKEGDLPEKLYVTFTDNKHKRILLDAFQGYERTAIAKELAEFWIPKVITEFREAVAKGAKSITFNLS